MEGMRNGALCLLFLEYLLENCYHVFLKFLLDFISGIIWACCCLNWKLITYRLNLYNRCIPYQFISFTCKILINYILQQFLNLIFIFVGIELFIIFIYYPFNVCDISSHGPSFISTVCNLFGCSQFSWLVCWEFHPLLFQRNGFWFCCFCLLSSFFQCCRLLLYFFLLCFFPFFTSLLRMLIMNFKVSYTGVQCCIYISTDFAICHSFW